MKLRGVKVTGKWKPEAWREKHGGRGKKCRLTGDGPDRVVSMREVKVCAEVCGSHYFEPNTMRFFKSRLSEPAYVDRKGGATFVTSEKGPNNVRAFTVRRYDPKSCSFSTVGEFQAYRAADAAHRAAKKAR